VIKVTRATPGPGAAGAAGAAGATGATGANGADGAKGDKGDPGAAGANGADGAAGAPGAKGDKGDKGDPGATGLISTVPVDKGPAGPITGTLDGTPGDFTGGTVSVTTTTATQRITAMISSFAEVSGGLGLVNYVLCFRASPASGVRDTAPTPFTTNVHSFGVTDGARVPFTAAGTATPGVGNWDVGLCVATTAGGVQIGSKQGFVQVTN